MKTQFEKMLTDKGNLSFMFTPIIALQITNGKKEFGIGWIFWFLTFKTK